MADDGVDPTPALWTAQVPLVRQQQDESDWCWAATASAIAMTYDPNSHWSQGAVVDKMITVAPPAPACSIDGSSDVCNQPRRLDIALQDTQTLANGSPVTAPIPFAQIQTEIEAGRPIGARIAWSGGGAHFVALSGVDATNQRLLIADPLWGVSDYSYADFCDAYRGPGNDWTHAYLTVPNVAYAPPGGGPPVPVKKFGIPPPASGANRPTQDHFDWAISRYIDGTASGLVSAIDVFYLGLADAADTSCEDPFARARRIGSRAFYNTNADVVSVEFDFDVKGPRQPHMSLGQRATASLVEAQRLANPASEIRLLKAPSINLQLLWVVKADGDVFLPIEPALSDFQTCGSAIDKATITTIVRRLAKRQLSFEPV